MAGVTWHQSLASLDYAAAAQQRIGGAVPVDGPQEALVRLLPWLQRHLRAPLRLLARPRLLSCVSGHERRWEQSRLLLASWRWRWHAGSARCQSLQGGRLARPLLQLTMLLAQEACPVASCACERG